MALVGAVFDLATNALPILLERVVALDQRLQFEAFAGVANLLAPQDINAPIDVFAWDLRFELFDAEEVLLVEGAQPLEAHLQFFQSYIELFSLHVSTAAEGNNLQIIETDVGFPVVEREVSVTLSQ